MTWYKIRQIARCKSAMRCAFATHDVNDTISGLQMGQKQAICAVRCALHKITFAMRYIFTAIGALAAELYRDVGHDASITASAMPRCDELRFGSQESESRDLKLQECEPRREAVTT